MLEPVEGTSGTPRKRQVWKRWWFYILASGSLFFAVTVTLSITAWNAYITACKEFERKPSWDFMTTPCVFGYDFVNPQSDHNFQSMLESSKSFLGPRMLGNNLKTRMWLDLKDPLARYITWDIDISFSHAPPFTMRLILTSGGWRSSGIYHIENYYSGIRRKDGTTVSDILWVPMWVSTP